MLKWTVRKHFVANQKNVGDEENDPLENIRNIYSRGSLGTINTKNSSTNSQKHHRRKSLGIRLNNNRDKLAKENHYTTPTRRKSKSQSSTPLANSSKIQKENCAKRNYQPISPASADSPKISPIALNLKEIFVKPSTAILHTSCAPTLPTFDVEYSPVMKYMNTLEYDELPSKRLKLDFLDISYEFKPESNATSSPLSTPIVSKEFSNQNKLPLELSDSSELQSMNSSDVGDETLQQIIDDILASARNGKKFKKCCPSTHSKRKRNENFMTTLSVACENMEQKSIERLMSQARIPKASNQTIIIEQNVGENEREVRSTIVLRDVEIADLKVDETCQLKRQKALRRKNTSNGNKSKRKPEGTQKSVKEFQDSTVQKCLSFSSGTFEDLSDKFKRSSVLSNSFSSSSSYVSQSKYSKNHLMKGSLEIAISTDDNRKKIGIHVIKCKNLERTSECPQINAYVKCALVTLQSHQNVYQRTAVHKNSENPTFDQKFIFDINDYSDYAKHIQIAVWHRNRHLKRSEFLGCLMIPIKIAMRKNLKGSFLLQPQISLSNLAPLIPESDNMLNISDNSKELHN